MQAIFGNKVILMELIYEKTRRCLPYLTAVAVGSFSGNGLSTLDDAISRWQHVKVLNLSSNHFVTFPEQIKTLHWVVCSCLFV